jgi:hypothetical protein
VSDLVLGDTNFVITWEESEVLNLETITELIVRIFESTYRNTERVASLILLVAYHQVNVPTTIVQT